MLVNLMQPAARDRRERLLRMPWIIAPPQLPLVLLSWLVGLGCCGVTHKTHRFRWRMAMEPALCSHYFFHLLLLPAPRAPPCAVARISLVKPDKARAIEVCKWQLAAATSALRTQCAVQGSLVCSLACPAIWVMCNCSPAVVGLGLIVTTTCCPVHPGAQDMLIMAARRGQIQEKVGVSAG